VSTPHTCPKCKGTKSSENEQGQVRECLTCDGSGVVWEPDGPREAAAPKGQDPLDLTYRG
jgi:DnaJ-class molecular chaperone